MLLEGDCAFAVAATNACAVRDDVAVRVASGVHHSVFGGFCGCCRLAVHCIVLLVPNPISIKPPGRSRVVAEITLDDQENRNRVFQNQPLVDQLPAHQGQGAVCIDVGAF